MKNIKISLLIGGLLGGISMSSPLLAADLLDVYQLARDNDPEIAIAEANFLAASEQYPQARAQYLPQVSVSAGYTLMDETESTGDEITFENGQPITVPDITSRLESDGWSATLSLRQTILNWSTFKEIQQSVAEVARAEAEFHAAQQQLIIRVAEAYFDLLAAEDSLEAAQINKEAIGRQLDQAKKRFEVGLIAITDVQESQAAFDQATAEVIAAERTVNSARETLRTIVGTRIDNPVPPSPSMPLVSPDPQSADAWVDQALDQNLAVIANRFALEAAEFGTSISRGGHYPTLDLVARHTETDGTGQRYFNDILVQDSDSVSESSFIGLELSVPLFSGGATQSRVRQAAHLESAARSQLKQAMWNAESQTRDSYLGVVSDIARVQALRQAYESAQTALKATQAGYEVGTRTAVDVLAARRNELQALVNYQRARYDYVLNSLRLKQAAGMLAPEDVAEIASWMEEEQVASDE